MSRSQRSVSATHHHSTPLTPAGQRLCPLAPGSVLPGSGALLTQAHAPGGTRPPQVFYSWITGEGLGVDAEGVRRGRDPALLSLLLLPRHEPCASTFALGVAVLDGQDTFQHLYNLYSSPAQPLEILTTGKGLLFKISPLCWQYQQLIPRLPIEHLAYTLLLHLPRYGEKKISKSLSFSSILLKFVVKMEESLKFTLGSSIQKHKALCFRVHAMVWTPSCQSILWITEVWHLKI